MSLVRTILKYKVPKYLHYHLKNRMNASKLGKLDLSPVDVSALRAISSADISSMLASEKTANAWSENEELLQSLALPELTGGVNPGDQRALFYIVNYFRSQHILEVGTHLGCSTVNMALAQKEHDQTPKKLTSVDILDVNDVAKKRWLEYGSKSSPYELISKVGCEDNVTFKTHNSLEYLKTCNEQYDLIFLDGDHSPTTVYKEVPQAIKLLKPGGLILLHDYFPNGKPLWKQSWPGLGPYMAMEKMIQDGLPVKVIPLGNLPWPTKFGSNLTSLALLTKQIN